MDDDTNEAASGEAPSKRSSRYRKVVALVILLAWGVIFTNPFHLNAPPLFATALLIGLFAPSVAAGILLKDWAFRSEDVKPSGSTRAFRISSFFATIILLPVVPFLVQVLLIIHKFH